MQDARTEERLMYHHLPSLRVSSALHADPYAVCVCACVDCACLCVCVCVFAVSSRPVSPQTVIYIQEPRARYGVAI